MQSTLLVTGNRLRFGDAEYRCAIGKGGFSSDKKEGDGATPLGVFALRECWYRIDRIAPPETGLPLKVIHENDGWCDDPKSPDYNRHILIAPPAGGRGRGGGFANSAPSLALPPSGRGEFSYERLWREDHRYDLIVPLGYNDDPVVPGRGSAIFLHVAAPDYSPTEGCVALECGDLLDVLKACQPGTMMEIRAD